MLPSWYQSGDVAKCSRESTCTAIGLLQPREKNSDFARYDASVTPHARRNERAMSMWMRVATADAFHKSAALVKFSDAAKTRVESRLFAILRRESVCPRPFARDHLVHRGKRAANAPQARVFDRGKFFTGSRFLPKQSCVQDRN